MIVVIQIPSIATFIALINEISNGTLSTRRLAWHTFL